MKISEIVRFADRIAPFGLAAEWDNVGLLVGRGDSEVDRALIALDITPAVVEEAKNLKAGLIVSHHPVIFEPLRALEPSTAPYLLARYDIAALCLHTDLDRAENGVNTALAKALGLMNVTLYPEDYLAVGEPHEATDAETYAAFVKERLVSPSVRYTEGSVTRVAVSSGGGGDAVELYKRYGFDAFVTGEMKHHQFNFAKDSGIAAFDAGHFSTENVVIKPLRDTLASQFPSVDFIISESYTCPYRSV